MHPNVHHWFISLWGKKEKKKYWNFDGKRLVTTALPISSFMRLHLHLSYFPSTAVICASFFLCCLQTWKYLFGHQHRHSSFVDLTSFWHHLLFAVQLNRVIRANKEQLWHQHLSSSSFSVDLSRCIDLSKKSQGCRAAWRLNHAVDCLTSFSQKVSTSQSEFHSTRVHVRLSSPYTKLAKSFSSHLWIVSQDFVAEIQVFWMRSGLRWFFHHSSSCQPWHRLRWLWRL